MKLSTVAVGTIQADVPCVHIPSKLIQPVVNWKESHHLNENVEKEIDVGLIVFLIHCIG
jgi:hypothetical protein